MEQRLYYIESRHNPLWSYPIGFVGGMIIGLLIALMAGSLGVRVEIKTAPPPASAGIATDR